jgi:phospholipid transport system substrate-binding protein
LSRILRLTLALTALSLLAPLAASAESPAEDAPAAHASASPSATAEVAADAPLATPAIEKLHGVLLDIMKNADSLGYNGRFDRVSPVVGEVFDMQFMASKSVGRHWKTLSPEDQQRWLDLFTKHIAANYAGQFTGYTGEVFETEGEEPSSHDTRVVHTRLVRPSDEPVQLNYRLRKVDGHWRIIDIYLNGTVSELALRRSEYSSVLKREGFESLMATIAAKCEKLEAEGAQKG